MKLSFNRGEWSEIYTVLYLLFNPNLELVDSKLNSINTNLLRIKSINLKNNQDEIFIKYLVEDSGNVKILSDKKILGIISKEELEQNKSLILNNILDSKPGKRSFTIKGIKNFLQKLDNENYIKANSLKKSDLDSTVHDLKTDNLIDLSYSIKSSLGSPSTILNSSKRTNFLYKINDLKKEDIEVINSIHTRAKLVDRINKIYSLGGSIEFVKVSDSTFDYNLKMIDSNLPFYLGNALLKSYEKGVKNLKKLFIESVKPFDFDYAYKKLGDFLESISFGLFPSIKWNGKNSVNGGLVIVKSNGLVVVIDLVYFKNEVRNYLIEQTKLDTPSSKRYNMLELYLDNNEIYFTLNLQIRYKK